MRAGGLTVHVDPWDDTKWALGAATLVLRAPFTAALAPDAGTDAIRARLAAVPGVEAQRPEAQQPEAQPAEALQDAAW